VVAAPSAVICDEKLLPTLVDWLIKLTSSKVYPLRHTSTAVATELLQACIDVATETKRNDTTAKRQLDGEKKKGAKKQNAQKITQLEERSAALETALDALEEIMKEIFNGVFVHRYRDTRPTIRALCMTKLGDWIADYPTVFLVDIYLKYMGWLLYDKESDVRFAAASAATRLYRNSDWVANLGLFTTRFKPRMLELSMDTDAVVAEAGIDLVAELLQNELLEDEEIEETCRLVKDKDPKIRKRAAKLIKLVALKMSEEMEADADEKTTYQLRILLEMCPGDGDADYTPKYIADALFDELPALCNWGAMTSMLLEEGDDALEEHHQRLMAGLMVACVRKACGVNVIAGETAPKLNKKQKDLIPKSREDLTTHFISELGKLMQRFQADETIMVDLVHIPRFMDIQEFAAQRKKKALTDLLNNLRGAYGKHSNPNLLSSIADSFHHLTDTEFAFTQECGTALAKLRDALTAELGTSVDEVMGGGADDQGPGPPGAVKRPWRSPQQIGFAWRVCMGAQGA
jgi:cohesin complex subunit SA-1/2